MLEKLKLMIERKEPEIVVNFIACSEGVVEVCRSMLKEAGYEAEPTTHNQQTFCLREQP